MDETQKKEIKELIETTVKELAKSSSFTDRKLTDTPTDSFSVVNRKFITNNGSVAGRTPSSVATIGQRYLDTGSNIPMWKVTAGWVNGVGSIVAQNN